MLHDELKKLREDVQRAQPDQILAILVCLLDKLIEATGPELPGSEG